MSNLDTTPYGIAGLRISLGILAVAHGLLKVFVFTIPGTVAFFGSLGYPAFLAYAVILIEILGGLSLIVGYKTRIFSLAMVPVLIGATLTHAGNGWVFSNPNGGWEFPAFWSIALMVQAALGSGAYALDDTLFSNRKQPSLA